MSVQTIRLNAHWYEDHGFTPANKLAADPEEARRARKRPLIRAKPKFLPGRYAIKAMDGFDCNLA